MQTYSLQAFSISDCLHTISLHGTWRKLIDVFGIVLIFWRLHLEATTYYVAVRLYIYFHQQLLRDSVFLAPSLFLFKP